LQLLHLVRIHAQKNLGADARTAQNKTINTQRGVVSILYNRLKMWMAGGFFGLSSLAPAEGWEGNWSVKSIVVDMKLPWVSDTASLQNGPAELGCGPLACAVLCEKVQQLTAPEILS
jgi:hypothetical protein